MCLSQPLCWKLLLSQLWYNNIPLNCLIHRVHWKGLHCCVCASIPDFAWCELGSTHTEAGRVLGTVTCNRRGWEERDVLQHLPTSAKDLCPQLQSPQSIQQHLCSACRQERPANAQWDAVSFCNEGVSAIKLGLQVGPVHRNLRVNCYNFRDMSGITGTASYSTVLYPIWC